MGSTVMTGLRGSALAIAGTLIASAPGPLVMAQDNNGVRYETRRAFDAYIPADYRQAGVRVSRGSSADYGAFQYRSSPTYARQTYESSPAYAPHAYRSGEPRMACRDRPHAKSVDYERSYGEPVHSRTRVVYERPVGRYVSPVRHYRTVRRVYHRPPWRCVSPYYGHWPRYGPLYPRCRPHYRRCHSDSFGFGFTYGRCGGCRGGGHYGGLSIRVGW
jgi:hypothetical protein